MNQMQHDFVGSPVAQDYTELLGTPFKVFLSGGVTVKVNKITKKKITEITDLPGLLAAVVKSRVMHPRKLSGEDLKYIRSALSFKSSEMAKALDMTPEHYSRCENAAKALSSAAEKSYRMFVYLTASCKDKSLNEMSKEEMTKKITADPERAKKAMEAFHRLFFEMKIQAVYSANDVLEFRFSRNDRPSCPDCPDEEWKDKAELEAA